MGASSELPTPAQGKEVTSLASLDTRDDVTQKDGELDGDGSGNYHRSIKSGQIHVMSLAYCMGSGVFITIGQSLSHGGPGNIVIAYAIVCTCVWAVLQSLAEMTIAFPVSGNIFDYVDRWVDPSLAFAAGFAEWVAWCAVVGSEATWTHILISFWSGDSFPAAASYTLLCAVTFSIFLAPTKFFAWFMYIAALIKIALFLIIVGLSLAIIGGAGSNGSVNDGSTWTDLDPFKNGFSGFANATLFAIWAVGDQIFMGIIGGEAENPRFALGHATNLVPWRIGVVFMSMVVYAGLLVPSDDSRLALGSTVTASPFVIAAVDAGIPGIPHLVNACMMVAVLSMAVEAVYIASRVLRTMAHQKLIPHQFASINKFGQPHWALLVTAACGALLSYINLSAGGATAFTWLISITSSSYFINWMIISFTSYRFRQALKAQNDPLFRQAYAWKSTGWPAAPAWLFICSVFFFICCFYIGAKPLGGAGFSAVNFFQYIIGILLVTSFTILYKLIMRTPWRDPSTADLTTGRRLLSTEDIMQLDAYYGMPTWRRFLTYLQLW